MAKKDTKKVIPKANKEDTYISFWGLFALILAPLSIMAFIFSLVDIFRIDSLKWEIGFKGVALAILYTIGMSLGIAINTTSVGRKSAINKTLRIVGIAIAVVFLAAAVMNIIVVTKVW